MPCSATITARGALPSASQWRMGSLVPSRAMITSPATSGFTPLSIGGAKLGAHPHNTSRAPIASSRTSHLQTRRQVGFVTQHQHAHHQDMVHPALLFAKGQNGALIIEKLRARHIGTRPAAIAHQFAPGTHHFIQHAQTDAETGYGGFDLTETLAGEIHAKAHNQRLADTEI